MKGFKDMKGFVTRENPMADMVNPKAAKKLSNAAKVKPLDPMPKDPMASALKKIKAGKV